MFKLDIIQKFFNNNKQKNHNKKYGNSIPLVVVGFVVASGIVGTDFFFDEPKKGIFLEEDSPFLSELIFQSLVGKTQSSITTTKID